MVSSKPTHNEANKLIEAPKIITAKVQWKFEGRNWRLSVRASSIEREEIFDVRAYIGRSNYSFALLYRNYVLRKFTKHTPHKINGVCFEKPHKHVWDGETENRIAYIPRDIDPDKDVNDQFLAFCQECNLTIIGEYQRVAYQIR